VYAAKGCGAIVSGSNGNKSQELAPGDFALTPAYAEHQEVNESDEVIRVTFAALFSKPDTMAFLASRRNMMDLRR
jgi:uncharacterized RmlC-like cupin family protein